MVTNGYRGKSVTFMGILMSFTLSRMLHEPSPLYYVLMAITIIKNCITYVQYMLNKLLP